MNTGNDTNTDVKAMIICLAQDNDRIVGPDLAPDLAREGGEGRSVSVL
jgi:hypothetical protein